MKSLDAFLEGGEWSDAEFKAARNALPKSVFETVSAFANTRGGWIVLGITQDGERFEVSGVEEPDKVQNDFLSVLHADGKVGHDVDVQEHRILHNGQVVLAFHVAENPRTRKPVYLDGDIRRSFLRKGGGDFRAQPHELERMLRDAAEDRWDSQPFARVDLDDGVFHPASLRWYRDRFHATNPGFPETASRTKRICYTQARKTSENPPSQWRFAGSAYANLRARDCVEHRQKGGPWAMPIHTNDRACKSFTTFMTDPR